MAKYLIINADDFGLNKEQNEAIKDLLNNKLITSTSLMSVAAEATDAVSFAKDIDFPVGVHITLLSMGILQARILEWVAMPCSRASSQPRD